MISSRGKFLFIDIVKTAGTSICQALEKYGGIGKHHSICRPLPGLPVNRLCESPPSRNVVDEYFCFTFVRNPYDRLISLFSYCQTAPLQVRFKNEGWGALSTTSHRGLPKMSRNRKTYWPTDFPTFVEWLVDHENFYCDFTGEKYIPMKDWIVNKQGVIKVSFVGRYENLQNDFDFVMHKISGETETLAAANESLGHVKLRAAQVIQSSNAIQSIIQSYYKNDFECFKYSTLFKDSATNNMLQLMR